MFAQFVRDDGLLVLGQDQDSVGGGYDRSVGCFIKLQGKLIILILILIFLDKTTREDIFIPVYFCRLLGFMNHIKILKHILL